MSLSLTNAARPRGQDADGKARHIDHIADVELEAAIRLVVTAVGGAGQEEIVVATARALGYSRTGGTVEARLRKCVQRMVEAGTLREQLGSLIVG